MKTYWKKTMKTYESVKINRNPNQPYIPDYPYSILIIGSSGSSKTYVSLKPNKTLMIRYW